MYGVGEIGGMGDIDGVVHMDGGGLVADMDGWVDME